MEVSAVLTEPAVDGETARACQLWKGIDSLETEATRSNSMAVPLRTITMTETLLLLEKNFQRGESIEINILNYFFSYSPVSSQSLSLVEPQFEVNCKECPCDDIYRAQPPRMRSKCMKCK